MVVETVIVEREKAALQCLVHRRAQTLCGNVPVLHITWDESMDKFLSMLWAQGLAIHARDSKSPGREASSYVVEELAQRLSALSFQSFGRQRPKLTRAPLPISQQLRANHHAVPIRKMLPVSDAPALQH